MKKLEKWGLFIGYCILTAICTVICSGAVFIAFYQRREYSAPNSSAYMLLPLIAVFSGLATILFRVVRGIPSIPTNKGPLSYHIADLFLNSGKILVLVIGGTAILFTIAMIIL